MIPPRYKDTLQTIIIAAVWFAIGWFLSILFRRSDTAVFEQVYTELNKNHVDTLPTSDEMVYAGIRGMIANIDDPHAAFIDPAIAPRVQPDFEGQSGVTGMFPELIEDRWVITVILPGQAAEAAGLREKDLIISVDGVPFTRMLTGLEASLLLRGPVGEPAEILVERDGVRMTFSPIREERHVVTDASMLDDDIAYFMQNTFTANAPEKVNEALTMLLAQEPKALIWDLRSNGGGSMNAAQEVLSFFIEDGVLFTAELKEGENRLFDAVGNATAANLPIIVLISERTYSSAEAAAISIVEHKRGVLIGTETHGKGTVQTTVPLIDDSILQFTVAHWFSPSGVSVEGQGVSPTIYVEDDPTTVIDEQLEAAITYVQENVLP
jgi:carboxyl-terminal processing protease